MFIKEIIPDYMPNPITGRSSKYSLYNNDYLRGYGDGYSQAIRDNQVAEAQAKKEAAEKEKRERLEQILGSVFPLEADDVEFLMGLILDKKED